MVQDNLKDPLNVSTAIEILLTESAQVDFECLLDHSNAEVSAITLKNSIVSLKNNMKEFESELHKQQLNEQFKRYILSLVAVNIDFLYAAKNNEETQ